jgi:hypothetical protein
VDEKGNETRENGGGGWKRNVGGEGRGAKHGGHKDKSKRKCMKRSENNSGK